MYFGSSCPYFEKNAVLICTEGRQPCPFWRQAVHGLWISVVHVYILKNGKFYLFWRQAVHDLWISAEQVYIWRKGSPYLYWRQAAMSILEAGSSWLVFWMQAVHVSFRQAVHVIWNLTVHVCILKNGKSSSTILKAGSHVHSEVS